MGVYERLQQITDQLFLTKHVNVQELAEKFDVSIITIRRDLERLAEDGIAKRIYGGAILNENQTTVTEHPKVYLNRSQFFGLEKTAIGRKAAELIGPREAIFLDIGTTVAELAKALVNREDLTIVTNSLSILDILGESKATVLSTGGQLRKGHAALYGDFATSTLKNMSFDRAFLGAGGVTLERGVTYYYPEQALVEKIVIQNTREINILADSSKIGMSRLCGACDLKDVDRIITDRGISEAYEKILADLGVELMKVDISSP